MEMGMTVKEQRQLKSINNRLTNRLYNISDSARRIYAEPAVKAQLETRFPDTWAKLVHLTSELPAVIQTLRAEIQ
jgi:hypothetical protein